jgi:hypothetical protein
MRATRKVGLEEEVAGVVVAAGPVETPANN